MGASLVLVPVEPQSGVSLRALCALFLKVGLSFGAGTGMSAVLLDELVRKRQAIARSEFMALYGLARLVPSGSMTALAVAIGYRYQRLPGSVVAVVAMILPSFLLTLVLTIAYTLLATGPALAPPAPSPSQWPCPSRPSTPASGRKTRRPCRASRPQGRSA